MRHEPGARTVTLFAAILILAASPLADAVSWKPITPEELALAAPAVEKDADAEAIFWDLRIEDGLNIVGEPLVSTENYVRIKIFTPKGKTEWTQIELRYTDPARVKGISARTIKKDGTIVEFDKSTIHEKTIVKAGGKKYRAKAFALTAVEPGCIIEYRWVEETGGSLTHFKRLDVQRDLPVQTASYAFKPLEIPGYQMRAWASGMEFPPFSDGKGGFRTATLKNIPTFREEPNMVPSDMLRRWMLIYYSNAKGTTVEEYWKETGISIHDDYKKFLKPKGSLKKAVEPLLAGVADPVERLRKIHDYVRQKVKNVSRESITTPPETMETILLSGDPDDVLERGTGTSRQINRLFAALAASAGFEVRLARVGDRADWLFQPKHANIYFLDASDIAVKIGGSWRLFDPGSFQLPFGELVWREEGQKALVCDGKEPVFVDVPALAPEKSAERRRANLKLDADGNLTGTLEVSYTGHRAASWRVEIDTWKADQREKDLRESVTGRLEGADVSKIEVEELENPEKPLVIKYSLSFPGFATKAGKRMLFSPGIFQRGLKVRFSASQRVHPLFFNYAWLEDDEVRIELPEGASASDLAWAEPFSIGKFGDFRATVGVEGRILVYRRSFKFAGGVFLVGDYVPMKRAFEALFTADNRELAISLSGGGAAATTAKGQP